VINALIAFMQDVRNPVLEKSKMLGAKMFSFDLNVGITKCSFVFKDCGTETVFFLLLRRDMV
jgi:hypothetical protein